MVIFMHHLSSQSVILLNTPVKELPETSLGKGFWVEVTTPYVDLILDNPPARSPALREGFLSSFIL